MRPQPQAPQSQTPQPQTSLPSPPGPAQGRPGGRRVLALTGTALVGGVSVALVVAGLLSPGAPEPLPSWNAQHAAMPPPAAGEDVPGPARQPSPDPGQRAAFLHRLEGIAPWLAPEEGAAMSRARATCRDILRGESPGRLVSDAQERFTDVTRQQAAEIVEAVREWCPHP
ncbi:DUF732 domain-containing protein [Nonomuraea sp. SMC257]|uniref:DUF732 domain-containing protein n=1 Tax=Nonomuraea montanisoli TaxID=2741721 RepID=A0A7Y6M1X6_9ACTN|nr:DUF732 domain-containing protein [Nonomuraea montanisoli]NUW30901.1 DUF732 domain-containing protein [Nonomuraea montanisoli]